MKNPNNERSKRITPGYLDTGHFVVAIGKKTRVHTELALMRYSFEKAKKRFKTERKIHLAANLVLSVWLLVIYLA